MIRLPIAALAIVVLTSLIVAQKSPDAPTDKPSEATSKPKSSVSEDFNDSEEKPEYALRKHREGHKPEIKEGQLRLLSGNGQEMSTAAWPVTVDKPFDNQHLELDLTISDGSRGFSVAWLNTANFGPNGVAFKLTRHKLPAYMPQAVEPEWDEPNLWGSLAVAFDCHNPNTENPFNEWGNIHNRTQREVSIHWDGREILNRHTDVDFANGEAQKITIYINMVVGGAEVTVNIGKVAVYDKVFIPHVRTYASRLAVGAVGDAAGKCSIDNLSADWKSPAVDLPTPIVFQTFRNAACRPGASSKVKEYELLPKSWNIGRIVMTIKLNPLMDRDEWDRQGGVFVYDNEERYELARVITPFMLWGKSYQWDVDVTDFHSVLTGKRKLEVWMGANAHHGFAADLDFTVYRNPEGVGKTGPQTVVRNVWNGHAHFNKKDSVEKIFGKRSIEVPEGAVSAKLKICVTGHGSLEFHPLGRTVKNDGKEFKDPLSTTDCYLNPQHPQYGTWKYNRAGWGPGSIGRMWEVPVVWEDGKALEVEYNSEPFKSKKWAEHSMESIVVFKMK